MRKIIDKSPNRLIDKVFNIPLFAADTQMYKCVDVSEITSSLSGKDYTISLSEVKQKYSVPERINIDMFIPTNDGELVSLHMVEVDPKRGDIKLAQTLTAKEHISSLVGLKEVFYNMAKKM